MATNKDAIFYSMQRVALLANAVMTITQLAKEYEKNHTSHKKSLVAALPR